MTTADRQMTAPDDPVREVTPSPSQEEETLGESGASKLMPATSVSVELSFYQGWQLPAKKVFTTEFTD